MNDFSLCWEGFLRSSWISAPRHFSSDHLGYPHNDVPSLTHPRSSPARPQEHFRRAVKKRLNLTVSQYTINLQVEWCCTNVQSVTAQEAFGCLGRKAQPPDTLAASGCKVKPAYLMLSNVAKK